MTYTDEDNDRNPANYTPTYTDEDFERDCDLVLGILLRQDAIDAADRIIADRNRWKWLAEVLDDNFADLNEVWRRVNAKHGVVLVERDALKAEVAFQAERADTWREEHERLVTDYNALKAEVWQLQERANGAEKRLRDSEAEVENKKQGIAALEAEVEHFRDIAESRQTEVERLTTSALMAEGYSEQTLTRLAAAEAVCEVAKEAGRWREVICVTVETEALDAALAEWEALRKED